MKNNNNTYTDEILPGVNLIKWRIKFKISLRIRYVYFPGIRNVYYYHSKRQSFLPS